MLKIKTVIYTALVAHILVALGLSSMGPASALAYEAVSASMQETPVLPAAPSDPTPQASTPKPSYTPPTSPPPPTDPVDHISGFTYKDEGDGVRITGYLGPDNHAVVPETIWGKRVTHIGAGVFSYFQNVTHVTIPGGITNIAEGAFDGQSLVNITVDKSNKYFKDVDGILFSKDGTVLMRYPAGKSDTHYAIPRDVTSIHWAAFARSSLASISIPDNMTNIDDGAFYECSFTSITIPNSVTSIGDGAFTSSSLTSITIPNSVTNIGDGAFAWSSLTSITIPGSVTSIGDRSFAFCSELTTVIISDGVTSIGREAFSSCRNLSSVTMSNSVTSIGGRAFSDCTSLSSITMSSNIVSIGAGAFYLCTKLPNITIPGSVTNIGWEAFLECRSLTVTCPRNSYAHQYCLDNGLRFQLVEPTATPTVETTTTTPSVDPSTTTTGAIDNDATHENLIFWVFFGGFILALVVITIIALDKKRKEQG